MTCDYCKEPSKYQLQNGERFCELCIKKKSVILTIDKCIEYLTKNKTQISEEQSTKLSMLWVDSELKHIEP